MIANADNVIEYTRTGWVDEIYIDLEPGDVSAESLIRQFLEMGTVTHVRVPDVLTQSRRKIIMEKLGDMSVITATMNYASPRQLFMKRCLDVTGGLIGCILTGILCIFLAPAIYIQSPGPIFSPRSGWARMANSSASINSAACIWMRRNVRQSS